MQTFAMPVAQQAWFWGLLAAWALLLFGGLALGKPDPTRGGSAAERGRCMPVWTRIGSSLVLVVAAWSFHLMDALVLGGPTPALSLGIAVGITFGALGDLFLACLIPAPDRVLAGIGAFGLGHVAYIVGMLAWASQRRLPPAGRWAAWVVWLLVGAVGWYLIIYRGHSCTKRHWMALPYALLLASTAGVATGLALHVSVFALLALGAALFLLSDLLLAANLFCGFDTSRLHDLVWLTYGPGQMLIVYALILPLLF